MQKNGNKLIKYGISYGRVSSLDKDDFNIDGSRKSDGSPEAQRLRCIDHMKYLSNRKGQEHQIIEHLIDDGFSGKDTKRPAFQKLWDSIESGKISFVVATELSRLSRSVVDFLEFMEHCGRNNVEVFIIGLNIDTSDPFGRMLLTILVALAQFEREVTGKRIKENALIKLIEDGKINGASEILGLVRDPDRPGHFLVDEEGLVKVEKVLKLFLKFSSKKKVLDEAKRIGLTGKKGKELTLNVITNVLNNCKWRYRGLWYANKENVDADPLSLPESKRFQLVKLPHGKLIDEKLLDQVVDKVADTYDKRKRSGKNNYTYLLTNVLVFEDGSKFGGQPAKDRQYRYYHNRKHNIRIRCDEIDPIVTKKIKDYLKNTSKFEDILKKALKDRFDQIPKVDARIRGVKSQLLELQSDDDDLLKQYLELKRSRQDLGVDEWLGKRVESINDKRSLLENELKQLEQAKVEAVKNTGLDDLKRLVREFVRDFSSLSRVQQQSYIERIFKRIIIKKPNHLIFEIWGLKPSGALRNPSTDSELNGRSERI